MIVGKFPLHIAVCEAELENAYPLRSVKFEEWSGTGSRETKRCLAGLLSQTVEVYDADAQKYPAT